MLTLPETDLNAIQQLHRQWMAAEIQGRSLDVLQYCTDDVQWLVPRTDRLVGKAAARPLLESPGIRILDIVTDDVVIQGCDRIAYKTCRYTTQFTVDGHAIPQETTGTHLWILHKEADEQWRVALVTWQLGAPS